MTQTHIRTLFHSDVLMHNTVRTRLLITWFASRKCCETISKRTKKTRQKAHLTMTLTEKEKNNNTPLFCVNFSQCEKHLATGLHHTQQIRSRVCRETTTGKKERKIGMNSLYTEILHKTQYRKKKKTKVRMNTKSKCADPGHFCRLARQ